MAEFENDARDQSSIAPTPVRSFGLTTAIFLVVANMIGAGVFTTSGFSLASLENRTIVLLAWLVGGLIAICGAVSYGQLARQLTESGGEYLFLSRLIHPSVGFVAGWVSLLAGFTGAIAFAAKTFETYALPESAHPDWYQPGLLGIASIISFGLLHSVLLRTGLLTQNAIVVVKLVFLFAFVVFALIVLPMGRWEGFSGEASGKSFSIYTFAASLVWISLSYSGFNAAVYVTSEVDQPSRNVPRALLYGTLIVFACYLLLNFVFLFAPTFEAISGKEDIAAITAGVIGGSWLEQIVRGIICLALLSSVSSMVVAGPRVYAKMADDGLFPSRFQFSSSEKLRTPVFAIWLQVILASIVVYFTTLKDLLGYLGFTLSVSAALTVACLFWSGRQYSSEWNVKRVMIFTAAAFYLVCTITIAILSLRIEPLMVYAFLGVSFSGIVAYFLLQLFWKKRVHRDR